MPAHTHSHLERAGVPLFMVVSHFFNSGYKTAASHRVLPDSWRNRKLMAPMNGTQGEKNCTDPGKKPSSSGLPGLRPGCRRGLYGCFLLNGAAGGGFVEPGWVRGVAMH